eukprot:TRINITY_DN235_c0_g1_i1.p1 TRINITY_DN235_c0_g1~~TRINITY_DN235_c0_g1_i1.p1  ORF type:complete len:495 (-),score=103.57 TRINITY_DN235_c0_g1_i1:28-1470(-)
MKRAVVLLVLLGVLALVCSQKLPGFNSIVSQKGLSYGTGVVLQVLQGKLKTITVPNQSGEKDSIDYSVENIRIQDITIPMGSTTIDAQVGLVMAVSGVSAQILADWHFREKIWPHVPFGNGDATINLSEITINVIVSFGLSAQGKPTVSARSVGVEIGHIEMHFSGSHLDFILNLLKGLFQGAIKDDIQKAMVSAITSEVNNNLNSQLSTLNTEVNINHIALFDLSLVKPIIVSNPNFIVFPQHGEFYQLSNPVESPYLPNPNLPASAATSQMLQMYVDQYVANSAAWVFWKLGKLVLPITANEVPSDSPIKLNTSTWEYVVPKMYSLYPNWLMQATVSAIAAPITTISPSNATVFARTSVLVEVINPKTGALTPVFTLGLNLTGSATAKVVGNNIVANILGAKPSVGLISSNIGPINTVALSSIITYLVESGIVPQVNAILAQGIPIPTLEGVHAVNPSLSFGTGYVFVSTDVVYTPPQ